MLKDDFLPIGTVVMLKGGKKRLMITGLFYQSKDDPKKIMDYAGCLYPEGILDSKNVQMFNQEQIEQIYYRGLEDDDEARVWRESLGRIIKQEMEKINALPDNDEKAESEQAEVATENEEKNKSEE